MDIKKTVGMRINSALARSGMLQKDLAKVLGVTDNTISYYCNGARSPQLEQLPTIAKALNTTVDYLLGVTADPDIKKSAVDDLGLSPFVISKIQNLQRCTTDDCDTLGKFNRLLEDENIWVLLYLIHDYITATKAESIYDSLMDKHGNGTEELSKALLDIAPQYEKTDIDLYDFLIAKAQSYLDGPLLRLGLDERSLSELIYLRIDRQLHKTLTEIEDGV